MPNFLNNFIRGLSIQSKLFLVIGVAILGLGVQAIAPFFPLRSSTAHLSAVAETPPLLAELLLVVEQEHLLAAGSNTTAEAFRKQQAETDQKVAKWNQFIASGNGRELRAVAPAFNMAVDELATRLNQRATIENPNPQNLQQFEELVQKVYDPIEQHLLACFYALTEASNHGPVSFRLMQLHALHEYQQTLAMQLSQAQFANGKETDPKLQTAFQVADNQKNQQGNTLNVLLVEEKLKSLLDKMSTTAGTITLSSPAATFTDLTNNALALSSMIIEDLRVQAAKRIGQTDFGVKILGIVAILLIIVIVLIALSVVNTITRQVNSISDLLSQISIGNFSARAEITSHDELGVVASSLNSMLDNTLRLIQSEQERDAIQSSIKKLLDEVSGVASGDLTVQAEVTADFTGAIADSFNFMISQLREIVANVQDATLQVSSSANEIQATTEHLSRGSEAQAAQILDTSAAIDEMVASISQVADNSAQSAAVAEQARDNAKRGAKAVNNTIRAMERIRNQVQETAKRIKRLGESAQEVGEVTQLIGDIADRTSILALNASIQAAMAGEAGQGFAVVAEEVERLAERSNNATKQIATLVKTIQSDTNEAVAAMEESTREVVEGSKLAADAGQALAEIDRVSNYLADLINQISTATKQQYRGADALAKSMSEISEVTQATAAGTRQAAIAVSHLAKLADELRASVSTFKLPSANGESGGSTIMRRFQQSEMSA